jgi:hypothetical protein
LVAVDAEDDENDIGADVEGFGRAAGDVSSVKNPETVFFTGLRAHNGESETRLSLAAKGGMGLTPTRRGATATGLVARRGGGFRARGRGLVRLGVITPNGGGTPDLAQAMWILRATPTEWWPDRDSGFVESLMRILWNPSRTGFGDGFDLRSLSAAL